MAATVTAKQRAKVIALAEQGKGRNDIVREVGVAAGTVTKIVRDAGLSFDRKATRAATDARMADSRARRSAVAAKLLAKADQLLADMDKPFLTFNIGGKDNVYTEHLLDRAPTGDIRNLMQAASTALQRHMDLELYDADQKAESAKSMLGELGRALGIRPAEQQ